MSDQPLDRTGAAITAYPRAELERLAPWAALGRGPFTPAQIDAEIARRDAIRFYYATHPEEAHA